MADEVVREVLGFARRIAVVGLSPKSHRASHGVAATLQARGYEIIPVNPHCDEVLGVPAVRSLADVEGRIDLVDVFRAERHLPEVARQAVEVGAPAFWAQLGLRSPEARKICEDAGVLYVENRCLKIDVDGLSGQMQLPPPPEE